MARRPCSDTTITNGMWLVQVHISDTKTDTYVMSNEDVLRDSIAETWSQRRDTITVNEKVGLITVTDKEEGSTLLRATRIPVHVHMIYTRPTHF